MALVGLVLAACATAGTRGTIKAVTSADVPALAGVWQGTVVGVSGRGVPATLTVNADSTYILRGGAFTAQGRAEVNEGRLDFVSTATSGVGSTGDRIGTAVVVDRGDTWAVVGWGRSPAGPYNFEFSKTN
jgi:hypothetical protein